MKLIILICSLIFLAGCANQEPTVTSANTDTKDQTIAVPTNNYCGTIRDFAHHTWFQELKQVYQAEFGDDNILDSLDNSQKSACLAHNNYFVFSPDENQPGKDSSFVYTIDNQELKQSPDTMEYTVDSFSYINNQFVGFSGRAESGDCITETYGQYFYKENKVSINQVCNYCGKDTPGQEDCKNEEKIFFEL